jgi:hypothetical protein
VTRNVMLMNLFFVLVHGVMLAFMLHNPDMVKDSTCPPCAPCGPVPVCAKCAPVPQYKPCATVQAWQLHITPNTSVPNCDCPKYEAPTCDKCAPMPEYKPCPTVQAWKLHITPNTSVPRCDVCPPPVQCPKVNNEWAGRFCVRGRFCG